MRAGIAGSGLGGRGLSRRRLLGGLAGGGLLGGGLLGKLGRPRAEGASERRFLFLFAAGGWDPTWVFAPTRGSEHISVDPQGAWSEAGGIGFLDSASRPSVRSFFERFGGLSCVLNGFEIRSVTHERCRRILMTGTPGEGADDWAAQIAAPTASPLPCLVISGPSYTALHSDVVVRAGERGQLSGLLDGSALEADGLTLPGMEEDRAVEAFLRERAAALEAVATPGQEQRSRAALRAMQEQATLVRGLGLDLQSSATGIAPVAERARPALDALEAGHSRCAIIAHEGQFDVGWDSHTNLQQQSSHFEILFQDLISITSELQSRTGSSGRPLIEEVTVVVCSEMGRTPMLNSSGGKDHWTWTSAMLLGAGVAGGQVVGDYDDHLFGVETEGRLLTAADLGATLLAMADLDPGPLAPIAAMMA